MPARKKGGRGGERESAGRKPDDPTSKKATDEEKNEYWRNYRAKERSQTKVPEPRKSRDRLKDGGKGKVGRPALDPEQGPLRGERLAEYKLESKQDQRKRERLSKVRLAAYMSRKDKQPVENLLDEESDDKEMEVSLEEVEREEPEEEKEESKADSKTSFYRKLDQAKAEIEKMSMFEQVDVTVKLLTSHDFDETKVGVTISGKEAKQHLSEGLTQLSPYHLRERCRVLLGILESHADGEGLLRSLLRTTVTELQKVTGAHKRQMPKIYKKTA